MIELLSRYHFLTMLPGFEDIAGPGIVDIEASKFGDVMNVLRTDGSLVTVANGASQNLGIRAKVLIELLESSRVPTICPVSQRRVTSLADLTVTSKDERPLGEHMLGWYAGDGCLGQSFTRWCKRNFTLVHRNYKLFVRI